MRAFLDSNVWLSAAIGSRNFQRIISESIGVAALVTASAVIAGVREKLRAKFRWTEEEIAEFADPIPTFAEFARSPFPPVVACRDPDDDAILAMAIAEHCTHLVTGDKDLLVLREFRGVKIVTPREFLTVLEGGAG